LPLGLEPEGLEPALEDGAVEGIPRHGEHAPDVAEVFLGTTLAIPCEFPEDHVLGGRYPEAPARRRGAFPMRHGEPVERIAASEIDVGLEAGVMVDEVEMAVAGTTELDADDLGRRHIEGLLREDTEERGNVEVGEFEHEVHVMGHPRLSVEEAGDRPGDEILEARLFERAREESDEIKW
jgi:hypothetical protein